MKKAPPPPDDDSLESYWNAVTPAPLAKTYKLYVTCRKGGVSQDGGLHATTQSTDDKAAVKVLRKNGVHLTKHFDEVSYTVKRVECDGNEVIIERFGLLGTVPSTNDWRSSGFSMNNFSSY